MKLRWNLPLVAAILLSGVGLYYLIFEVEKIGIWLFLLVGAVLNYLISFKMKAWNE